MSDSMMSVIGILLATLLMFIFPLMTISKDTDKMSAEICQVATTSFVNKVMSYGKIEEDDYNDFLSKLAGTHNSYNVNMELQVIDSNSSKYTTISNSAKVGENSYYSIYNSQIEDEFNKDGEYKLKQGDTISIIVNNTNETIFQTLQNFIYRVTGKSTYNISAQHAGVIAVDG